jgi:hypothetical protein
LKDTAFSLPQYNDKNPINELQQFCVKQNDKLREEKKAEFLNSFQSIVWMTYRNNFDGIITNKNIPKEYQYRSDSGWGCMLRSSQMLCANCILRHLFGDNQFSLTLLDKDKDARIKYISLLWQ